MVGKSSFEILCEKALEMFSAAEDAANWVRSQLDDLLDKQEVIDMLLHKAIKMRIYEIRHEARNSTPGQRAVNANTTTTMPSGDREIQGQALAEIGAATMAAIWDEYTIGDLRLAECTKADLLGQVASHDKKIRGFRRHHDFLKRLASKMPNDESTVRDNYDVDDVEKLHEKYITSRLKEEE